MNGLPSMNHLRIWNAVDYVLVKLSQYFIYINLVEFVIYSRGDGWLIDS